MIAWRTCGHSHAALRTTDSCKIKLKRIYEDLHPCDWPVS
jgi:hypothetical protein